MSQSLTIFIYRFLLVPLVRLLVVLLKPFFPQKIRQILQTRETLEYEIRTPLSKIIWFHCSSGEFEYARPLIRTIKKHNPEFQILVTYFSTSYVGPIRKMPEVDAFGALPIDTPSNVKKFLDRFPVETALFARTDVWPEMSTELRKRKIPSFLFSLSLSEKSTRSKFPTSLITQWALSQLTGIFCVSKDDLLALKNLDIHTPAEVTGDSRYDQVFYRLEHRKHIKDVSVTADSLICVAGSTWPEDESVLLEAFAALPSDFRLILVPHEPTPHHIQSLSSALKKLQIDFELYSSVGSWTTKVLIVDQMGILAELYASGTVAFVGGSFKKTVHSVMEPLALGLPTLVGPLHHNNREALAFKKVALGSGLTAVSEVNSAETLKTALLQIKKLNSTETAKTILHSMNAHRGSSEKTWQLIKSAKISHHTN